MLPTATPRAEGKPIPTELRREEAELRHQVELEDDNTAVPRTHIDDEYAHAGEQDPKVLITTSRDPSSRLVQFAKELKLLVPNAQRINRGGQVGWLLDALLWCGTAWAGCMLWCRQERSWGCSKAVAVGRFGQWQAGAAGQPVHSAAARW